ncbi:uncharacterized protein LOC116986583 [Amblyraja radiata]|uniref:uncharacterized protein LOC116986583 n=1 Tax=Amblyraja radiata TaxID=386614 RepID=UPI00140353AE|nr:uncharacterized protein LOC116986583 [Amblyraja radiata]
MESMRTFLFLLREVVNSTQKDCQAAESREESRAVIQAGGHSYLLKKIKRLVTYLVLMIISASPTLAQINKDVEIRGLMGGNATLPCYMEDGKTTGLTVYWQTEGLTAWELRNNKYQWKHVHPSFHSRVEVSIPGISSGNLSMNLQQLQLNDSRKYECIIIREGQPTDSFSIKLKVMEPEVVMEPINPITRNDSSSINTGPGTGRRCRYFLLIPTVICLLFVALFENVFDRVDRGYLFRALHAFGIGLHFVARAWLLYTATEYDED